MRGVDRINNMQGVCLAELVIGMATALLILAAVLEVLQVAQSAIGGKQRTIAQQQDLRLGLEVFEQEVRLATAGAIISATRDKIAFVANLHAQHTNTTATVLQGQSVLPVLNGSGWSQGKTVAICGRLVCEMHRLSRAGQQNQLTFEDSVGSMFPAGASVDLRNRVSYYTKEDEKGAISLMRMVDGGANVLIGELDTVNFSYRDKNGRVAIQPSEVARVLIEIQPRNRTQQQKRQIALRS